MTNTSTYPWNEAVRLGSHWRDASGHVVWDSARVAIPPLAPGASATLTVRDRAPLLVGRWLLEWEIVDEGFAWSGDKIVIEVRVRSD